MPVAISADVGFGLTFSSLPNTISSMYANLDQLLNKMVTGSILPVITTSPLFSKPFLLTLNVVGHCVLSEDNSTHTGYRDFVSATHANQRCNSKSPHVKVCLGDS